MSFLAYFLTMFSSPKRKSDLLTVKQFCRTGIGLYRAIVRALCALVCLKAPGVPPAGAGGPCWLRFWSEAPSPEPSLPATASPKRAILEENTQVSQSSTTEAAREGGEKREGGLRGAVPQPPPPLRVMLSSRLSSVPLGKWGTRVDKKRQQRVAPAQHLQRGMVGSQLPPVPPPRPHGRRGGQEAFLRARQRPQRLGP